MPIYELGDLNAVKKSNNLGSAQRKESIRQILEGVSHLHASDIIHRDLKPGNVLVRSLDPLNLVISDFGQVSFDRPNTYVGTVMFRAPEIDRAHHFNALFGGKRKLSYTKAVDIYSVGVLLLWLLGSSILGRIGRKEPLWSQEDYNKAIGSEISAATKRHRSGEVYRALITAKAMSEWDPNNRPSAATCLGFRWLRSQASVPATPVTSRPSRPSKAGSRSEQPSPRRSSRFAQNKHSNGASRSKVTRRSPVTPKRSKRGVGRAGSDEANGDPMSID